MKALILFDIALIILLSQSKWTLFFLSFGEFVFSGDCNFILLLETRPLDGIYLIVLTFVCVLVLCFMSCAILYYIVS